MRQDKVQRVLLYAKHAQEKGIPITVRELARQIRVSQWELFEYIDSTPLLRYWSVDKEGNPIHRQGLFTVEYIAHDQIYGNSQPAGS